jgi:hypothetical protein
VPFLIVLIIIAVGFFLLKHNPNHNPESEEREPQPPGSPEAEQETLVAAERGREEAQRLFASASPEEQDRILAYMRSVLQGKNQ